MVNDGHTIRPRCATRSLGGRYIDGKPEEVPPDTRRFRRFTKQPVHSTMVYDGHGKGQPYQQRCFTEKSIKVYDDHGKGVLTLGAHRGPAEVPQRFTKLQVRSTMVYDGHGKGPPYRKVYQGLQRPRQSAALPKSLPSSERIWTCGGCTRSGIAGVNSSKSQPERHHPGANDFIL